MSHRRSALAGAVLGLAVAASSVTARAGDWTPDSSFSNPQLHQRLYRIGRTYLETNFDPAANLVGTSSKHPPNTKSHAVRESAYYAFGLLLTGDTADRDLAQKVLRQVFKAQDKSNNLQVRGAFNWYFEVGPPEDLNSAAFVGSALADIANLDRQKPCLDDDVRQQLNEAGKLAVEAIMHRDVQAGYTNIAQLSTGVAAAGAKLWNVPGAGDWASKKLDAILALAGDSEYAEYLSPTYYAVSIGGAYAQQKYAFSAEFSAKAEKNINHLWQCVAASYHAPTFNLAGPYVRAYGDNMLDYAAGLKYDLYLALDGNYPLVDVEKDHAWDSGGVVLLAALPITPRAEFQQPIEKWREFKVTNDPPNPVRTLRQYKDDRFTLGTVAYQDEWKQKRNLVSFWRTDGANANDFRIGYCIDESNESMSAGVPPDRIHFWSTQHEREALVALSASTVVPGVPGVSMLACAKDAKVTVASDGGPTHIEDGSMIGYLYPIANGPVQYKVESDTHGVRVTRGWPTADAVGDLRVMSYLLVFRRADEAEPKVSNQSLSADAKGGHLSVEVDGTKLSLDFPN